MAGIFGLPRRADDPDDHHLRERGNHIIDDDRASAADSQGGPIGLAEIAPTGGSFGRADAGLKARLFFVLLQIIMSLVILGIVSPGVITRAAAEKM